MSEESKYADIECFELRTKKDFDKDERLDLSQVEVSFVEQYNEAILPLIEYFSHSSELPGVEKIKRQGELIRPQFSGRRKKHEKIAIGLVTSIISHDASRGVFKCKPLNEDELKEFYKYSRVEFEVLQSELFNNISWFIDLSQVYPFSVIRIFKILYNPDKKALESFLKTMYGKYSEALSETIGHLKVPEKPSIDSSNTDIYIVLHRCQRAFVSSVLTPRIIKELLTQKINKLIFSNTVAYLVTSNENVAYYYSIILNYLVHSVKVFGGQFIINQYGRPVEAIRTAGLEWVNEDWQVNVAKLSKQIHEKARPVVLSLFKLPQNLPLFEVIDRGKDIEIKEKLGERSEQAFKALQNNLPELYEAF